MIPSNQHIPVPRLLQTDTFPQYVAWTNQNLRLLTHNPRLLFTILAELCSQQESRKLQFLLAFVHKHGLASTFHKNAVLPKVGMYPLAIAAGISNPAALYLLLLDNTFVHLHREGEGGHPSFSTLVKSWPALEDVLAMYDGIGTRAMSHMTSGQIAYQRLQQTPTNIVYAVQFTDCIARLLLDTGSSPLLLTPTFLIKTLRIPVSYQVLRLCAVTLKLLPTTEFPECNDLLQRVMGFALDRRNPLRRIGVGGTAVTVASSRSCAAQNECPLKVHACLSGVNKLLTEKDMLREKQIVLALGLSGLDPRGLHHALLVHSCKLAVDERVAHTYTKKMLTHGLVYEYAGAPLTLLLKNPPDRRSMLLAMVSLVRSVDVFSRNGIRHLDLKPDNIMCTVGEHGEYNCKLIDFGLAIGPNGPMRAPVYANVYTWPFETIFLATTIKTNHLQHYLQHAPRLVSRDKAAYSRVERTMTPLLTLTPSDPGYHRLVRFAVERVDAYQIGLILSHRVLLGPSHVFVMRLVHPDPHRRPSHALIVSHLRHELASL